MGTLSQDLIDRFYEQSKDKYGLSKRQINDICRTPFKLIHLVVEDLDNDIPIRIMNLGIFRRGEKRLRILIQKGRLEPEKLEELKKTYNRLREKYNK